jgi:hypothetical protein
VWFLVLGAVFYGGYRGFRLALDHFAVAVLTEEKETPIEEQILLDQVFFPEDFGKKRIVMLRSFEEGKTVLVEGVAEPRPLIIEICKKYGEPDTVEDVDLAPYGIKRTATVNFYGRLGLASPKGQTDGKIFWVVVR